MSSPYSSLHRYNASYATLVRSQTLPERQADYEGWIPAGEESGRPEVYHDRHSKKGKNGQPEVQVRQQRVMQREMLQLVYHPQRYSPTFVPATIRPSLTFDQVAHLLSQRNASCTTTKGEERHEPSLTFAEVERILDQGSTTNNEMHNLSKDADSNGQPMQKGRCQEELEEYEVGFASSDIKAPQVSLTIDQSPEKDGGLSHDQWVDQRQNAIVDERPRVAEAVSDVVFSIKKNVTDDLKELQKALSAPLSLSSRRTSIASRLNSGMILRVPVEAEQMPAGQSPGYRRRAATMAFHSRPIPESNNITDTEDTVSVHSMSSLLLSGTTTPSDSGSLVNFRSRLNSLLGRDSPHHLAAVYSINKPIRRNTISFTYTVR